MAPKMYPRNDVRHRMPGISGGDKCYEMGNQDILASYYSESRQESDHESQVTVADGNWVYLRVNRACVCVCVW